MDLARLAVPNVSTHQSYSSLPRDLNPLFIRTDTDQVSLGPGLVIKGQSIGVASTATGFQGVDGILGYFPSLLYFFVN